jgi:hypothetical protein
MILLCVVAGGSLVACWIWGDLRVRTKCLFTVLYSASWGLCLLSSLAAFVIAQCLLSILVGGTTFGLDWLMSEGHGR